MHHEIYLDVVRMAYMEQIAFLVVAWLLPVKIAQLFGRIAPLFNLAHCLRITLEQNQI